ncbi:type II toxin-antitoxin system RelE/ParE family toxin [Photorhabdus luminescens]|uniref:Type II toxin-antitoxin system mRNA interferase toxin, RelE/StbE family n=1 Tax=Photorhabdus luminescens subsp. mexicana TaxID=2100167 RepID=A0A4R4J536_PHOLU|nr:type II toxin-antitoxin system RelE/ParE family toxin [Photorhabdus luminescens]TDB48693.1 type II toxin-antitoxin system mRNA interferase toxin, RelE/StbE family [Photorhabdus luminescens subsp. mexicana]
MELEWKPMALADREAIMEYIALDNPFAAIKLDNEFEVTAETACQHPNMYKPGRVKGTREAVVHPHYVIIYRVQGNLLQVLRVLHTAQQWL